MAKKWQNRLMSTVNKLGLGKKMEAGALTADDQKQLFTSYQNEFGITFDEDKELDEDADLSVQLLSVEEQQQYATLLGDITPPTTRQQANIAFAQKIKEQNEIIDKLEKEPEKTDPIVRVTPSANITAQYHAKVMGRTSHTPTHLFGIEDPMFSRGKWYVDLTINRQPIAKNINLEQKREFKNEFNRFSERLINRSNELSSKNLLGLLDYKAMIAGQSSIDYSDLFGKLGEYSVPRTDIILAYLRSLPSADHIFPMRSNIQNKEEAPGATFGELSQGYRPGKIFKGNVTFTAEIYRVTDLMFKFLFKDLIRLEKQYIGYLNREGSDVIKWTFIEWIMIHFGTILKNEQNVRRVIGVRVPQQNVIANPSVFGADGAYRAIERVEEELKVYPNPDYKIYSSATIVEYFEAFWDYYTQILPSIAGYKLYANLKHRPWYIRQFRQKYGKDTDFSGVTSENISDVDANIIWVPNMPMNNYKLFLTIPGNIENYEGKPNEMLAFYFERDWEEIGVMARWKEGSGVQQAGVQFKKTQDLIDSNYEYQWLFTNFPATELNSNANEIDAKLNSLFLTDSNTEDTNISLIKNYRIDSVIKVVCGSMDNPTTIKKTGIFSKINEDYVPNSIGDWIKFYPELEDYEEMIEGELVVKTRPTGKFLELERRVTA